MHSKPQKERNSGDDVNGDTPTADLPNRILYTLRQIEQTPSKGRKSKQSYYATPETRDLLKALSEATDLDHSALVSLALRMFARDLVMDHRNPALDLINIGEDLKDSADQFDERIEETIALSNALMSAHLDSIIEAQKPSPIDAENRHE